MAEQRAPEIFIVSDGRGETANQLVKACLVQFEGQRYRLTHRANVRTAERVREIVSQASDHKAIVFYTLVGKETREEMSNAATRKLVPTVDLLGPTFSALHTLLQREPSATPGLLYAADRENFDRRSAIDYTLKHDDGQRPNELNRADVVLVGVSRASKSSTCFYLAYEGIKAANVPLVPGVEPPPQLLRLDRRKVIGLRVNVMRLMIVREARAMKLGREHAGEYLDKRSVAREVTAANRIMEQQGWRSFDASYMAIEEIAREVMRHMGRDPRRLR
jgi:regulator of PEP synthase PpsR (kinase-PPPase family)